MTPDEQPRGGLMTQSNFRTVHAEDARSTTGRTSAGHHFVTGKKTELHDSPRDILGEI